MLCRYAYNIEVPLINGHWKKGGSEVPDEASCRIRHAFPVKLASLRVSFEGVKEEDLMTPGEYLRKKGGGLHYSRSVADLYKESG